MSGSVEHVPGAGASHPATERKRHNFLYHRLEVLFPLWLASVERILISAGRFTSSFSLLYVPYRRCLRACRCVSVSNNTLWHGGYPSYPVPLGRLSFFLSNFCPIFFLFRQKIDGRWSFQQVAHRITKRTMTNRQKAIPHTLVIPLSLQGTAAAVMVDDHGLFVQSRKVSRKFKKKVRGLIGSIRMTVVRPWYSRLIWSITIPKVF